MDCVRTVHGMAVCETGTSSVAVLAVVDQSYLSISGQSAFDMTTERGRLPWSSQIPLSRHQPAASTVTGGRTWLVGTEGAGRRRRASAPGRNY